MKEVGWQTTAQFAILSFSFNGFFIKKKQYNTKKKKKKKKK